VSFRCRADNTAGAQSNSGALRFRRPTSRIAEGRVMGNRREAQVVEGRFEPSPSIRGTNEEFYFLLIVSLVTVGAIFVLVTIAI
jgi:hypothetical protein